MEVRNGSTSRCVGVAVVGLGGAVATTAAAGIELLRTGAIGAQGLPLAGLDPELTAGLVPYEAIILGGWDIFAADLARAAATHAVLSAEQLAAVAEPLGALCPWPAVGDEQFCRSVGGDHRMAAGGHAAAVEQIREDLRAFREREDLDGLVMINLASTEALSDAEAAVLASPNAFRRGIEEDAPQIGPAMLYAYAAILEGVPYANFTPSVAAEVPALRQLATDRGVPVAGKDGKTGQTLLKTVLAPALRDRALKVEGWFSTNLLGNRDGLVLADEASLASKLQTKRSVLEQILGYPVEDHVVRINYYRPRGDDKEAWDNIDLVGFLGQKMQLKVNFLCKDSILAAPLVIELVRLLDLAQRRGEGGVQEQLGAFFKSPMTLDPGAQPEHAFPRQQQNLFEWLAAVKPAPGA